jgi:hypothetical protein
VDAVPGLPDLVEPFSELRFPSIGPGKPRPEDGVLPFDIWVAVARNASAS